jgi:hypothetical protein
MKDELSYFIDSVYKEPYSLIRNNCIHKSLRIKAKAEELGGGVDLLCCMAIMPVKKWHNFPIIIIPHVYTEIDGKRTDVSLDPESEKSYCQNSEVKIVMPLNISKIRERLKRTYNGH